VRVAEKLKVVTAKSGLEIVANREGLMGLAAICLQLAMLPEDDAAAEALGNHYHYGETFNNAEDGSIDLTLLYKPNL
jgi:hypothetical protein